MKKGLLLTLMLLTLAQYAQVGPYSWQDHMGLYVSNSVARFNGKIYASNYQGLVIIDPEEGSGEKLNKVNGLNDVGVRLVRANPYNNRLLVVYENANIDVVDADKKVSNAPDIKLKVLSGKKIINEVFFSGKYAYLATGFGIILFDTEKREIKDTYVIGPGGSNLEVYQVALNDSLMFAATPGGLYYANYKLKLLNNFNNWKKVPQLPVGIYGGVVAVQNKIIAAYSPSRSNGQPTDSLYVLSNGTWSNFFDVKVPEYYTKLMHVDDNYFSVMGTFGPKVIDAGSKTVINYITSYNGQGFAPRDIVFFRRGADFTYWVADAGWGLYQTYGNHPYYPQNQKAYNGVRRNAISNIDVFNGKAAISPSMPDEGGGSPYLHDGVNFYKNGNWDYFETNDLYNKMILDINSVLIDRKDESVIWASSWVNGLLMYKDKQLVAQYNASNSNLGQYVVGAVRSSGLDMDDDGNLWVACSDAKEYLAVRKRDGSTISFDFKVPRFTRRIMVDRNNMIWALHERDAGLTVFKPNNFGPAVENVNYRVLTKDETKGNLGSNAIYSIAEDKDGKIWIGTREGIRVMYSPQNIFTASNYDAQPIKIVQDGNVELLLEKETITAIVVDGANNKWVGSQSGGLYCFSPDGQNQLYHFTKENSPLYSNYVIDLDYDKKTGDIYIATDMGLQSFRSPIIEGEDNYNSIYAYPNPVRPGYSGHVFVRGLVDNSVVKVTDEGGNLVWEVKSAGGQVEWPLTNLSGEKAASGVYVIYAHTPTGELKGLTKVMVVN